MDKVYTLEDCNNSFQNGANQALELFNIKVKSLDYALKYLEITRDKGYSLSQIARPIENYFRKINPSPPDNEE